MKKLFVPKLDISTKSEMEAVAQCMKELEANRIDTLNWADQYPSKPEVKFRMAHNGESLFLQYEVHENELLAAVTDDNGAVWTDSCVEFFISFDQGQHYYNAEFSCIGKALLGYRTQGEKAQHASNEIMQSIERFSSLGMDTIAKTEGDFRWILTLKIPTSAFWKTKIDGLSGLEARANFYKCGDNLSVPHFVSWSAIDTPTPSFHQPRFFGQIVFE